MKIVACVRTLNEENNIEKFCNAFQFVDEILVADGGSMDSTMQIALGMPKTSVRHYPIQVECKNGIYRNPDGPHIQFLINWAESVGADWILFQDCDHRPNRQAKEILRQTLEEADADFLLATQIFLWCGDQYFPSLSIDENGEYRTGLWGWRTTRHIRMIDKMPHYEFSFDGENPINPIHVGKCAFLHPPSCFLHFGWETEEKAKLHMEYYRKSGLIPTIDGPRKFGGVLKPIEDWMVE